MAGRKNKVFRVPKSIIPRPKTIAKRGLYELMWGAPQRDYGKRVHGR